MLEAAIYVGIGIFIGWVFLPEPAWVRNMWNNVVRITTAPTNPPNPPAP